MLRSSKREKGATGGLKNKEERLLHFLLKRFNKAHRLYQIIEEGERIAVGVSSGMDSLCLLLYFQKQYPVPFELGAVHIEPDFQPGHEKRRVSLEKFIEEFQLPFASIRMSLDLEQASLRLRK